MMQVSRGDIYMVDLGESLGSEQAGRRPALIVQNNIGNTYSPTTMIALMTSKSKPTLPTHVLLKPETSGVRVDSVLLCEQMRTIDKCRLGKRVGKITDPELIKEIDRRLMVSMGIGG